jgi:hypothetical protein
VARPANNQLLDKPELKQWILRRLGAPVWKVELCEEHVDDAIEQAIRWFAAKKGQQKLFTIEVVPGQPCYELDCEIDKVLDVAFSETKLDLSLVFSPFTLLEEKIPYDVFASGGSGGLYSSYVQSLQYIEMAKRVLSAELEWTQINNQLFLAPSPTGLRTIIVLAKINFTQLQDLMERDHDLVKRYALAKAMQDLAWIRGKFGDYPGAQGTITFNWDRMLDWADTEITKLEEEIFGAGYPMGFVTG